MSYRCEDYPCCGCGPEGCVDRTRIVVCKECGTRFHPDQNTEEYCYRCQITAERNPKFPERPIRDNFASDEEFEEACEEHEAICEGIWEDAEMAAHGDYDYD